MKTTSLLPNSPINPWIFCYIVKVKIVDNSVTYKVNQSILIVRVFKIEKVLQLNMGQKT